MSVAILPSSPITYGQAPVPTLLAPGPSPAKRPKLSLDTKATPPAFGKASTSLRLETLSATSPTARNTFQNGYSVAAQLRKPGARRPVLKPLTTSVPPDTTRKPTPLRTELHSTAEPFDQISSPSSTSATSVSTIDSLPAEVPYKISYNVQSILRNGPLPRESRKRRSLAQARPMFPPAKKVAFQAPLTEDIRNTKYTMAHSDIDSSSSTISTLALPPPKFDLTHDNQEEGDVDPATEVTERETSATTSPQTGEKRESSDEEDSDTCPVTPVAGRRKRHRQWVWTLAPLKPTAETNEEVKSTTTTINDVDDTLASQLPKDGEEHIDSAK
ncbi:hypothetical protein LTR86_007290 [Recurvomyces mirabilis]|nr:hypothetical protein LTR86_007290 [Recurvomyces mirabilis]